jgi:pimeloyl-ACP methyl ester carboxylesterase
MTRAIVCAAGFETTYVRAGCGIPVVMLDVSETGERARECSVEHASPSECSGIAESLLATRCRVLVPCLSSVRASQLPARLVDHEFSNWLSGFLDGLGITRASIVARGELAEAALRYAIEAPERVDRLVVLVEAGGVDGDLTTSRAQLEEAGIPVFVGSADEGATQALAVLNFLLGAADAPVQGRDVRAASGTSFGVTSGAVGAVGREP